MEMSYKDKKLLVYLLTIGIIAAAYFFVAKPFMDKRETLDSEVDALKNEVNHYNEIYSRQSDIEQQISDAEERYAIELSSIGNDLSQENTIMMLRDIEKNTGVWISKVSFQDVEELEGGSIELVTEENSADEASSDQTTVDAANSLGSARRQGLSIEYSIDYSKLKDFLEYVNTYSRRLYISSITMAYSVESNIVSGSLNLYQFEMPGSGDEVVKPDLSGITVGKDNVFSNYKFSADEEMLSMDTIENGDLVTEETGEVTDESGEAGENAESSEDSNEGESETEAESEAAPEASANEGRRNPGDL